jgi:hypothetical protein
MFRIQWVWAAAAVLSLGCASPTLEGRTAAEGDRGVATESDRRAAAPAIAALQQGRFDDAEKLARQTTAAQPDNPHARLVGAIARYERAMRQLVLDGRTLVGGLGAGAINQRYLRTALTDAESELAAVEADLAIAAKTPGLSLELCLACWELDWNGSGRVDERDRLLLQIEQDEAGEDIPEDDPRRKPTFRFDEGDIPWARAFVSYQRAALDLLLAYDWTELAGAVLDRGDRPAKIVIRLVDKGRVAQARARILEGLDHSDASRLAYLAETDDDREWVPSPRQKNHPMPLTVDSALYDTWEGVVGDVRRLVSGEEGLFVADLFTLAEERVKRPPTGYLDIGRMLSRPADIEIDLARIERIGGEKNLDGTLAALLGDRYARGMKPSPLPRRLLRMKAEIEIHEGELDRKLRYLFWLN